jgi:NADH:ubiquinone oxidoreductase subunit 6 (subunit J)
VTPAAVEQTAFLVLALVAFGGAIGVVAARSVFTSALALVLSLLGVAGLYVLLDAGFIAVVQILIYVGAISVLILFAVMLTPHLMEDVRLLSGQWALGLCIALITFGFLGMLAYGTDWPIASDPAQPAPGAVVIPADSPVADAALELPGATEERSSDGSMVIRLPGTTERLGAALIQDYLLPFEVVSALLLVALVGAIAIARE